MLVDPHVLSPALLLVLEAAEQFGCANQPLLIELQIVGHALLVGLALRHLVGQLLADLLGLLLLRVERVEDELNLCELLLALS